MRIFQGIVTGLISGTVLGLFLKLVETITNLKVYTLLLNIDFIYIGYIPEILEFIVHLAVSVMIGIIFVFLTHFLKLVKVKQQVLLSCFLTVPTVFLYFPLTIVSIKETPELLDFTAILWWTLGHLLYALILPIPLRFFSKSTIK
ncbi:hypothetical protein [Metabacillus endolithicus]|uniref:DUF1440 domain-containing protein n=1 Tax=Metabacillus endolithicus TaxID=1535204 RepID=A0ABW5BSB1_9BACI